MAKCTTTAKAEKGKPRNRAAQEATLINVRKLKKDLADLAVRVDALEDRTFGPRTRFGPKGR